MSRSTRLLTFLLVLIASAPAVPSASIYAQTSTPDLERRVAEMERQIDDVQSEAAGAGLVLLTIGCVCALWAQNSRRSPWLWFFLGMFGNVIALAVMLYKNSRDIDLNENPPPFRLVRS